MPPCLTSFLQILRVKDIMRLLLDTHIFLWCVNGDKKLTKSTQSRIISADEVYVSSASIWEITIKIKLNKLQGNVNEIVAAIEKSGFLELPITFSHAAAVANLPDIHRDPFDRILIAQSITEPLTFITADEQIKNYSSLVEVVSVNPTL